MRRAAEPAMGQVQPMHHPRLDRRVIGLLLACLAVAANSAVAGPQGGQVVAGQGDISNPTSTTTLINQQSNRLVIDWTSFNIASNETVQFDQPSVSAMALNRILDQNPSQIFGSIIANGQVYLLNPNGIIFGKTAIVNVGGLFATGLNISNSDFMSGNLKFAAPDGQDGGYIVNHGVLQAADGGSINLIGSSVLNDGIIIANLGQVNLAAGSAVTVDFNGDGLMQFQVTGAVLHKMVNAQTGAAITNAGKIEANGGTVVMTAAVAEQVLMQAVNNSGIVQAAGIQNKSGHIYLTGSGGDVINSGTLNASSASGNGGSITLQSTGTTELRGNASVNAASAVSTGGSIQILGNQVGVLDRASVNASGAHGGGTILVGGDEHGAPGVQAASATVLGQNASLTANATTSGNGGEVVLWSKNYTGFYGHINVQGGMQGGNGGFVETSSRGNLQVGGTVNATAPAGPSGTWLLDPQDVNITNVSPTSGGTFSTGTYTPSSGNPGNVYVGDITTALAGGTNVTITTTCSTCGGNGDITVTTPISGFIVGGSGTANLALQASGSINIQSGTGIAPTAGTLNVSLITNASGLSCGSTACGITVSAPITTNNGSFTAQATGTNAGAVVVGAAVNTGTGAITLQGNGVNDSGGAGSLLQSVGGGTVSLVSAGASISLTSASTSLSGAITASNSAGGAVTLTNATATQLGNVTLGTGALTVSGTGITQVGGTAITQAAGGGAATFNGGAGPISLGNANTLTGVVALNNSGANAVSLTNTVATQLGASAVGGSLSVTSNGTLTESGTLTVTGAATFTQNSTVSGNQDILLGSQANDFQGTTTFAAGVGAGIGTLSLRNVDALATFPTLSSVPVNLTLIFNAAGVSIPLTGLSLTGNLSITAGGAIGQNGTLSVGGVSNFAAGSNGITLSNAGNNFTGAVTLSNSGANNVTLNNGANLLTLGGASSVGAGTLTLTSAGIVEGAGATITQAAGAGVVNISAGAGIIALGNANNFTGAVTLSNSGANAATVSNGANALSIGSGTSVGGDLTLTSGALSLGTATVGGNLSATTTGAITQTGALGVTGATTLAVGAANNITLSNAANAFTGAVGITSGNNVLLTNNIATVLGASTVSGTLGVTSNGAITQTGVLAVTGAATFQQNSTTAGATQNITLDTQANNFSNTVTFTTGAGAGINNLAWRNVNAAPGTLFLPASITGALTLIYNNAAITLPGIAVGGALAVTSNGAITQSGALSVVGASAFNSSAGNGAITLNNAGNLFTGADTFTSGTGAVTLVNNLATVLGASTVGGAFTVTSNGAITQTGALGVTGTSNFSAGANAITLSNAGNNFTGAVTLSNSGANNVTLNNGANLLTLGGASSVGTGTLTLTSAGIVEGAGATITQAAGAGVVNISAGAGIIALNNSNSFTGTVSLSNSGAFAASLSNSGNLTLSTVSVGNSLVASSTTGSLTLNGAVTTTGGNSTFNAATNMAVNAGITATGRTVALNVGTSGAGGNLTFGSINIGATTLAVAGGVGNDSFDLHGLTTITTTFTVNGGNGTNTLIGNNSGDIFNITGINAGNITGLVTGFSNIENLTGGTGNDTFTLASGVLSFNGSITGGGGVDTLAATDGSNAWQISGANAGTLNTTTTFSGISNLVGGTGNDSFVFSNAATLAGTVSGGAGGSNVLDFSAYSTAVGITLSGPSGPFGYSGTTSGSPNPTGGFADITQIDAPTSLPNTLTLANGTATTVTITGSVPTNLFNLTVNDGGTSNLTFTNIGTVNGGTGVTNTLISGEATNNLWTISATNGGTYNDGQGLIFSNFADLMGGTGNDSFTLAGGTLSGSINGGAGINTLMGDNVANTWTVTGANTGTLTGIGGTFANIQNLTGGTGNDSFTFSNGATETLVNGGAGGNSLNLSAYTTATNVSLTGPGSAGYNGTATGISGFSNMGTLTGSATATNTLTGDASGATYTLTVANGGTLQDTGSAQVLNFGSFQNLVGGSGADNFVLAGGSIGSITGGGGNDTLTGDNSGDTFNITGSNSGMVTSGATTLVGAFSNVQNLMGGAGNDGFVFQGSGSLSGNVNGGSGSNTLNYAALAGPVNVTLSSSSSGTGSQIGGTFSGIGTLVGSAGSDMLTGPNTANTWTINGTNAGNVDGFNFSSIESLMGGSGSNSFLFTGSSSLSGNINGGSGAATGNSLQGNNSANTWSVTGANQGTVTGLGGTFTNIGNLIGGTGTDNFIFANGASLSGSLNGGGVTSGNDTIDWSAYTTARNVTITGAGTADGMQGTEASITGGFDNITDIVGANGAAGLPNSLAGPNSTNIWNVTGSNAGTLDAALAFSDFQILSGGTGADTFSLSAGVSGSINGGGGADTVNIVGSFIAPASTLAINNVGTIADNAGATVTAGTLAISGATSIGSASKPLLGNLGNLQIAASNGNAFINTVGSVNLQGISLGNGTLTLASGGAITDTAGQSVAAGAVNLTAVSGIGTAAALLKTVTTNLSAAVSGVGDINISNTGALTLGAVSTNNGAVYITSAGVLIANGPVTSGGNITLTTSSGDITTAGTIAAGGGSDVSLVAAGQLNLDSTVSSGTGILSLTGGTGVTGNTGGNLAGSMVTVTAASGDITFTGVTSGASGGTTLQTPGNITLQGFNTTRGTLTIQNGGTFMIAGPVNLNGALAQTGAGPVVLDSNVTSNGGSVQLASPTAVGSGTTASIATGSGAIIFDQGITGSGGASSLTLNSGVGNINLQAVSNLGSLILQASGTLSLGNGISANSLLTSGITGSIAIVGASVSVITANTTVDFSHATGINGLTSGSQALAINSGSGNVILSPVGQITPLASLTINGGTIALGNVTTSTVQSYTGNVQLAGNLSSTVNGGVTVNGNLALISGAALSAAGGGGINISGTVDGAHALTLMDTSGPVTLGGVVGGSTPLASLTVNSAAVTLGSVTTSGNQNYQSGAASLAGVLNSKTGAINFGGRLDITSASTIQANTIGFDGGASSVRGNTTLTLLPETNGLAVNIGGSGSGLTLNNIAMDGYDGALYIGAGPAPNGGVGISVPVAAGNVTVNGSLTLGNSASLVLVGLGNLSLDSGTLTANSVTLVAGSQNSVMQNPGAPQTLINANTVVLVSGGQIGQLGQELNVQVPSSVAQVQIATGAIQSFLSPPTLPVVIGPTAVIADTIAAQLGLFVQANSQVTSIGQQIAALAQTGGLLQGGFIDVSLFQNISLYDVFGSGIMLPMDQCERPNSKSCHPQPTEGRVSSGNRTRQTRPMVQGKT